MLNLELQSLENKSVTKPICDYRIYHDDCLNVMSGLEEEHVDLLLTDPPYNLGKFMKSRNVGMSRIRKNHFISSGWDDIDYDDWTKQMKIFFDQSFRIIKTNGALLVFMSLMKLETIINLATESGFYYKTVGIWHKTNPMPRNMQITFVNSTEAWIYFLKKGPSGTFNNNNKMIHDHFETSLTPMSEKKLGKHPTQKPIKLISQFVDILSNPNELVLDPFMGSGSTGVASLSAGRNFIGSELNLSYFKTAQSRLSEFKR